MIKKVFNKKNLIRIFILFIIGLSSRLFINNYFNINVFIDYLNPISLIYYTIMATLIVSINELFKYIDLFNLSSLYKFILITISHIKEILGFKQDMFFDDGKGKGKHKEVLDNSKRRLSKKHNVDSLRNEFNSLELDRGKK